MNRGLNQNIEKKELMTLAIDLGENDKKYLKIYSDTKPEELAYNFCYVNQLDYNSLNHLTEEIRKIIINNINSPKKELIRKNNFSNYDDFSKYINKKGPEKKINNNQIFENVKYISNKSKYKNKLNNSFNYIKGNNIERKNSNKKLNNSYYAPTISSSTKQKVNITNSINDNTKLIKSYNYKRPKSNFPQTNHIINEFISKSNKNISIPYTSLIKNNKKENYGEKLYNKCKKNEEIKKGKIQQKRKEEESKVNNECTFKPKINKTSYHSLSNRFNNILQFDENDHIINYDNYIDKKKTNLYKKYNQKDENCYFKPKINETKEKDNNLIPRYEQLYQNSKQLKSKREFISNTIYDGNLFRPSINRIFNNEMLNLPFNERQNIFNSRTSEKKIKMKNKIENDIDTITGQKLFQPQINQNSHIRKRNSKDTFNNLYSDYEKKIIKRKQAEKDNNERFYILETLSNKQSNEIYEKNKINSFEKIFNILDKDQDGKISNFNIYINGLPKNIKNIIFPILNELKEDNKIVNKSEFCNGCFKLFENLNYLQKKEIMNFGMHKKNSKESHEKKFTFKPKIITNYDPNVFYEKQKKEQEEENTNFHRISSIKNISNQDDE